MRSVIRKGLFSVNEVIRIAAVAEATREDAIPVRNSGLILWPTVQEILLPQLS